MGGDSGMRPEVSRPVGGGDKPFDPAIPETPQGRHPSESAPHASEGEFEAAMRKVPPCEKPARHIPGCACLDFKLRYAHLRAVSAARAEGRREMAREIRKEFRRCMIEFTGRIDGVHVIEWLKSQERGK